ncbi:hypothetical protein LTR53_001958 [Teratosphaeriaceae sp. CCFEE 6253]|nr:hypothetical protein LTR53_001958 [Teratosphaeriaceae sp. CCFEE 6253]
MSRHHLRTSISSKSRALRQKTAWIGTLFKRLRLHPSDKPVGSALQVTPLQQPASSHEPSISPRSTLDACAADQSSNNPRRLSSAVASAHSQDGTAFVFFALPRELRNNIYSHLTCQVAIRCGEIKPSRASIRGAPIEKLLTLNKQFREEYEAQLQHDEAATLILENDKKSPLGNIPLGPRSRGTKHAEVHLHGLFFLAGHLDAGMSTLAVHRACGLGTLQSLHSVKQLHANYYEESAKGTPGGSWSSNFGRPAYRARLADLTVDMKATSCKVFSIAYGTPWADRHRSKILRATWTQTGGWQITDALLVHSSTFANARLKDSVTLNASNTRPDRRPCASHSVMAGLAQPDTGGKGVRCEGDHEAPYFDFFGLPRELRDWIYDLSTADSETCISSRDVTITMLNRPDPTLLTINPQFAHEYGQQARKQAILRIEDDKMGPLFGPLLLPSQLERVEVHLMITAGYASAFARSIQRYAEGFLRLRPQFPKAKLSLSLYFWGSGTGRGATLPWTGWDGLWGDEDLQEALMRWIVQLEAVRISISSAIYGYSRCPGQRRTFRTAKRKTLRQTWSTAGGWVAAAAVAAGDV